jgi:hypothetical protein
MDSVIPILLKFLYNNQDFSKVSDSLNSENIFIILSLSYSLGCVNLSKKLTTLIVERFLNEDNCVRILNEAYKVNL